MPHNWAIDAAHLKPDAAVDRKIFLLDGCPEDIAGTVQVEDVFFVVFVFNV